MHFATAFPNSPAPTRLTLRVIRLLLLVVVVWLSSHSPVSAEEPLLGDWKTTGFATPKFLIQGTGARSNPLRRPLRQSFTGDELFVGFRLQYDAESVDTPSDGDGEFVVLWLDEMEGNDASTHSGAVPNVGVHTDKSSNRFMVRYSPSSQRYGPKLIGGKPFHVVARLWKSRPGNDQPFDKLDLWVDPKPGDENQPAASTSNPKAISRIAWLGVSTGGKTEPDDRITVWELELSTSWRRLLKLPDDPKPSTPTSPPVSFTADVLPILQARCFRCHEGDSPESEVRLDVWDEVLNHTTPRDAERSRLYQLAAAGEMPPNDEQLSKKELDVLNRWISHGLTWDEKALPTPIPVSRHWAFQALTRVEPPTPKNEAWIRSPVDAFIAARHEAAGLKPAREAKLTTLQRRMTLDLTGLPVEPGNEASVESLLGSEDYAVRWARHWLDVGRWAESNGHQHNRRRAHAWRYRDWVVDAFREDKPFDQFLREQVAGDELTPPRESHLIATGFLAAARYSGNELDKAIQRNDILVDVANTTASAFLGLTMECAQCHSHKFDPLSIRDYYQFQAVFAAGQPGNIVLPSHGEAAPEWIKERWSIFDSVKERLLNVRRRQGQPAVVTRSAVRGAMNAKEKKRFAELDKQIATLPQSWSFYSPRHAAAPSPVAPHEMRFPLPRSNPNSSPQETLLLIRGDVGSPGPRVRPAWPRVFGPTPDIDENPRSALADWMCDPQHPLTARVWVNRIWQWHFGKGLVATSGDFGDRGARPSHPQLLDYLANELIASGWKTSHIHRLILESATYRQSSQFSAANAEIDPENRLLWRWRPRRLEAEAIRDCLLAVSGQLDRRIGGPSATNDSNRRTLYLRHERDRLPDQQLLFDVALGGVSCSRRRVSTNPIQPLWLLNSKFAQRAAEKLAERAETVDEACRLAWGREPTEDERQQLQSLADQFELKSACLAILNSSEFLYLP